jgi:hypothetical protein
MSAGRWALLVCGAALLAGCRSSKGKSADAGSDHPSDDVPLSGTDGGSDAADAPVSFDVAPDIGVDATSADVRDAAGTTDARDAGASTDVRDAPAATDVRDAAGPTDVARDSRLYVDPVDGAVGCPDGGFPLGRGPCDVEIPLYGGINYNYGSSGAVCTYPTWSRLWFSSEGVEVHLDLAAPISAGAVGNPLPATFWINQNPTDFVDKQRIWATPTGACTITMDGNVCWYFGEQRYQIVTGRGSCNAPAVASKPDGGAPITVGDFWFSEVLNPM